jgi:hypothetical protein
MKLSAMTKEKADDHLRSALTKAKQDDRIRAILILEPDAKVDESDPDRRASSKSKAEKEGKSLRGSELSQASDLKPSQFPTRTAYREALIDLRQSELSEGIGETIQRLRDLSLEVHGGQSTRAVVIEGSASNIDRGLQLPGVRSGALDVPIGLR